MIDQSNIDGDRATIGCKCTNGGFGRDTMDTANAMAGCLVMFGLGTVVLLAFIAGMDFKKLSGQ